MTSKKNIRAIVLAAGKSSRMGVPKFSLRYDEKDTFIEKIIASYLDFGCREVIVVMNSESIAYLEKLRIKMPSESRIVLNAHPEWARFYSLKTGAGVLTEHEPVFVSNIDNPYVSHDVLTALVEYSHSYDYVYPSFEGKGGHPFLLSAAVLKGIRGEADDQIHLRTFLSRYTTFACDVKDPSVLFNINTPEEYNEALHRHKK